MTSAFIMLLCNFNCQRLIIPVQGKRQFSDMIKRWVLGLHCKIHILAILLTNVSNE